MTFNLLVFFDHPFRHYFDECDRTNIGPFDADTGPFDLFIHLVIVIVLLIYVLLIFLDTW